MVMENKHIQSKKQKLFLDMLLGILLYSVVLGFFNDYTEILHTTSYSTTFLVAIVMQILTFLTFSIKDRIKIRFSKKQGTWSTFGLVFSIWLVLFLSKFVFLAVISFLFPEDVYISGFWGLMLIVLCLTIAQRGAIFIYEKLDD